MSERKEPTVSAGLNSKEELSDRRARASRQRSGTVPPSRPQPSQRPVPASSSSSGFLWFTFMVTLLAVAGGAYALWQLDQTQQVIKSQSVRIAQLEDKLALSDDSATQSLTSIGAKVRELNVKSIKVATEIDKLWATRNVNRNAIAASDKKIASVEKKQAQLAKLESTVAKVNKKVANLLPIKTAVESTAQRVTEQDLLLQSVRERVANHSTSLKTLSSKADEGASAASQVNNIDKRLKSTEEAITSIDAFRRTVNRDLLQLKQTKK